MNRRFDVNQPPFLFLLESVNGYRSGIGDFLTGQPEYLFTDQLGGYKTLGYIG